MSLISSGGHNEIGMIMRACFE